VDHYIMWPLPPPLFFCTATEPCPRVSKNLYRSWIVLGPGLTDVLHDARVAAASDKHRLEGTGAVHEPFHDHGLKVQFRV
jgi:hypothetical protein